MTERKFTTLRKRLDQLGYRQALGIESVPLVEKLFSDLVHTTESLKNLKLQHSKHEKTKTLYEDNVEPYRSDNAKLVKENNELHLQLIKLREDTDQSIRELKGTVRKLEHENADLKFLNTQYVHKVKALEKDAKVKTERIHELQEKNLHAIVETPGGRRKQVPFRRQRMDIESTVSPAKNYSGSLQDVQDPYVADLLSVADNRIEELEAKVLRLQDEKDAGERRNKTLRKQVESRDKEIDRLNVQLEGGRPIDAVTKDVKSDSSDRVVAHLNVQVDYLQQANRDLEKRLKNALDKHALASQKLADVEEKNAELLVELKGVDRLSKKLEDDKERDIARVQTELASSMAEIKNLQLRTEDSNQEVLELRKERKRLIEDNEGLAALVNKSNADTRSAAELLDKSEKERKRLSEKNAQLTINERDLVMELERLKLTKSVKGKKGRDKSPSRLDKLMKTLEKERDYYKSECDSLQEMMRKRLTAKGSPTAGRKTKKGGKSQAHLESMLQLMEEERDFYKRECELLRNKTTPMSPPTRERDSGGSSTEVNRLRRERDELQGLVEKFEKHMTEIQSNVKTLTQDRDKVQILYEQSLDEIQRLRRQVERSRSQSPSRAASVVLCRVEAERDNAVADLRRTHNQIENLEDKLKIALETQQQEKRRYEDKIANDETIIEKLESDRSELQSRVSSLRNMISSLESQVKQTSAQLSIAKDTAYERETQVSKEALRCEQAERAAEDYQRRLTRTAGELQAAEEKIAMLEERMDSLDGKNSAQRQEIAELRASIKSLDRVKDELQAQVDEKTEDVMNLEANRIAQEKAENELKINMEDLEAQLSHTLDQGSLKDREVKSLRRQLESRDDELAEMTRGREAALRENRRLQEDLNTMTEENQAIHQQLQECLEEQENLKIQISDYARQVARVEELLAQKEQEKEDILEQYRTLTSEAERLASETKHSTGQVTNYRMEIAQREQGERELRDKIRRLEADIEQYVSSNEGYEIQVSGLTRSMAQMEEQLRQANEDRESLLQDIAAVRELCMKLDQTRESLSRQLAAKSMDQEQLRELLDDAKGETETLRRKVFAEKENIRSLESVIAKQRQKEYVERKSLGTSMEEVSRLREELVKNDHEKSIQREEIDTLRQASDRLEDEVARLRKHLIAEKYEREKLLHETSRTGSRYSRNTDQRLHTSFTSSEFAKMKPKDMSSPLASDYSDTGRAISPIRRINHSDDDYSDAS
ncbi:centrosomal protein of 135 kDa-like isoform X2 [Nematostella vectensis]|uniref:centrosomal protein of 135 kDa-like isoform X2 n=1 Tax=Nematostella vectensis TaxID=45351 RepID=UPI00207705E8|nr:centrosomal protein of 135 kDa-like isoform X2 [Nematostella vectensis]